MKALIGSIVNQINSSIVGNLVQVDFVSERMRRDCPPDLHSLHPVRNLLCADYGDLIVDLYTRAVSYGSKQFVSLLSSKLLRILQSENNEEGSY